jgi:tripartite-type tricarboxylate transporter receptor subunit TctC
VTIARLFAALTLTLIAPGLGAQSYPAKPIRLIVPFAAGGSTDLLARTLASNLQEALGQTVIVDNRPGAGSNIGTEVVAKAAPDGYTLLMGTNANAVNNSLYANLRFDFVRDFAPISKVCSFLFILSLHPSVPASSVAELIALAKKRPGELTFSSAGVGTGSHLAGELFNIMAEVKLVHVPYKGNAPSVTDLLGGQVSMSFINAIVVLPHLKSGKLRGVAVTSAQRFSVTPELPTISEAGLSGFEAVGWNGLFAPTGTPREVIQRLNAETVRILRIPEIREKLMAQGAIVEGTSPEELAAFLRVDVERWAKTIKASGAKAE